LSILSKNQLKFWIGGGYHSYLRISPYKLVIKIAPFEYRTIPIMKLFPDPIIVHESYSIVFLS